MAGRDEGGSSGQGGMEEGVYAYHLEYKTMMILLLSSLSSLISLHRACATLLTATCSHSPIELFVALGP